MIRIVLVAALMGGCSAASNSVTTPEIETPTGPARSIAVSSERPGTVTLIPMDEAAGQEHGWWSAWHTHKSDGRTQSLPHTFTDVPPGDYVLVIFDPASENYDPNNRDPLQASDGVVIEKLTVGPETRLKLDVTVDDYTEWNCLSCPWLYVMVDGRWVKLEEVLKDVVGRDARTTTRTRIPAAAVQGRRLTLRIAEEKREVTHLERVVLRVGQTMLAPVGHGELRAHDDAQLKLSYGQKVELVFELPEGADAADVELLVSGWYEPEAAFLESVLDTYAR
jgi:hypothetical protein